MSDRSHSQTEPTNPIPSDRTEHREMSIVDVSLDETVGTQAVSTRTVSAPTRAQRQPMHSKAVEAEHLAARRVVAPLSEETPEVKQRLSEIRAECTTLVTGLRWDGLSTKETAERVIALLDVGPLLQWIPLVIPTLLEIDRAGNLIPVWFTIAERADALSVELHEDPVETALGRARRYATLMLGYYKAPEVSQFLGALATDPTISLYATQSLARQSTVSALQALATALKEAEGWAKVDIIEAYAQLNLARFHELLLASGLGSANGLESDIAAPLFRTIPLERYLRNEQALSPRLSQQAALILNQILQDSMPNTQANLDNITLPIIFERNLPTLATALFDGARRTPTWQHVIALHHLALLLGRYWAEITRGVISEETHPRMVRPIRACLPMMPEVERWMNGAGRASLLEILTSHDTEGFSPSLQVLADLREPRIVTALMNRLEATSRIANVDHARLLSLICSTLGHMGDVRAVPVLLQFANRTLDREVRAHRTKRREPLEEGNADFPGSIVYAAVVRACTRLGDRSALNFIAHAANDLDSVVRTQALEGLRSLDPQGNEAISRVTMREALSDPSEKVVQSATQMARQYHETENA